MLQPRGDRGAGRRERACPGLARHRIHRGGRGEQRRLDAGDRTLPRPHRADYLGTGQGNVRGHQQGHPGRHGRRGGAAAQRRLPVFSAYGVPHRSRVREDRGGLRVRRRAVRRLPRHPAGGAQLDRREVQQVEGAPRVAAAAPHVLHPPRVHRKARAVRRELQDCRRLRLPVPLPLRGRPEGELPARVHRPHEDGRAFHGRREAEADVGRGHPHVQEPRAEPYAGQAPEDGVEGAAVRVGQIEILKEL